MEVFRGYDIRGLYSSEINTDFSKNLGLSVAKFLGNKGKVIVGCDSRAHSEELKSALISGLVSGSIDVTDTGLATTDMVAFLTREKKFDAGIQITASHLTKEYNGFKLIKHNSRDFNKEDYLKVKQIFLSHDFTVPEKAGIAVKKNHLGDYSASLLKINRKRFSNSLKGLKIVFDACHGVGSLVAPALLEKLGAEVIRLRCNLDGKFNGSKPEPTAENLPELINEVKKQKADIGIATDGDADRVCFVDSKGNFIEPDKIIALIAPVFFTKDNNKIVCSINTSRIVEGVGTVFYSKIGCDSVNDLVLEKNAVFSAEPNGHMKDPLFCYYDSGSLFSLHVSCLLKRQNKSLNELVNTLPKTYILRNSLPLKNRDKTMQIIRSKLNGHKIISESDGIKFETNSSTALMRPSNTEDIIRIEVESETMANAEKALEKCMEIVS